MQFRHIADIHLGNMQYGLAERADDFGRAFRTAIRDAVAAGVDVILLAGDLFDRAAVAPKIYLQAARILREAREAGIPVIAIEGNHDQARYQDRDVSWLRVLSEEEYLILLQPTVTAEGAALEPWNPNLRIGGYIDIGPLRVIGAPYAATEGRAWTYLSDAIRALPRGDARCVVLLAHSGLEGEMDRGVPGLTRAGLSPLHPGAVDYLALGHYHKPFERDGWMFNPGSLEHCSMEERQWIKGIYDVTLTPEGYRAEHLRVSPRPFFREVLRVEESPTPAALYAAAHTLAARSRSRWQADGRPPVVEISLEGTLPFDRDGLDPAEIQRCIPEGHELLHVRINLEGLVLRGLESSLDAIPRDQLERQVLADLVRNDSRYSADVEAGVRALLQIKRLALDEAEPDRILESVTEWLEATDNASASDRAA